jgi:hypothetical protein
MVTELLDGLPATFDRFYPAGPISDRAFWESVPSDLKDSILATADALSCYEYPPLPASLYMDFSRTGNRTRFEEPYFSRRRALGSFVLAECVRNDGGFIDRIVDGIDAIAGESAWQLPAHNSYIRDTKQLPLPDVTAPVLDLFACETGALLAMVSHVMAEVLDRVSPFIRKRINWLLDERIIQPYVERHFWWMGNGDEPMCNWTPWCTQNVLIVAGLRGVERETLRPIVAKAAYSLDCFLKDYGEDGCCSEGAEYYRHAGLCLFGSIEVLDSFAPGVFSPLYRVKKIRNIAKYILDVHVDDRYYINFADCSPIAGRAGVREYLFGKRADCPELMRFAAEDWQKRDDPALPNEINLYYRVQAISLAGEIADAAASVNAAPASVSSASAAGSSAVCLRAVCSRASQDAWYPSVGLFIARSKSLCLAVKAGGNGDSHNHNDTGSFILYKDGKPGIIDIGVESYSAKTFSPERYDIWTMQSAWHNLPTFGDHMQRDGVEYHARDVDVRSSDMLSSISMELSGAWDCESGVRSFRRTIAFDKASGIVTVEDLCDSDDPPILSLMVALEPKVRNGVYCKIEVGKLAEISVVQTDGALPVDVEPVDLLDEKLRGIWGLRIWRIRIPFVRRLEVKIK